ncbi:MAG: hypothetical protein GY792_14400 [Gammaproteobacteria bacterium]|nr:hypothetical protein [Gammaproteobacteria bacterium]
MTLALFGLGLEGLLAIVRRRWSLRTHR